MEETSFDLTRSRVNSKHLHLAPDGGPRLEKSFDLRAYTSAELTSLLHRNGLEVRAAWGGIDRSEYSTESRRLVLLADRA
jgi:hypothetical protein